MKKVLAILGILLLLFVGYVWFFYFRGRMNRHEGPQPVPIAVSKHSDQFNNSVDNVLNVYYKMTEGFVNWDTTTVNKYAAELRIALDSIKTNELKKDTAKDADKIYLTAADFISYSKNEAGNILQQATLDKKREALNSLADNLRNVLITVKYDKGKVYYQECPMAFNEDTPGYWLSPTEKVRNPYLGTMHPKYHSAMLECGKPKDSIDFMVQDTVIKHN